MIILGEYLFKITLRKNKLAHTQTQMHLNCNSTCFKMQGCTFTRSCTPLPARRDMLTFLQYLFNGTIYQRSSYSVHRTGLLSPHFGNALRAKHPTGRNWEWTFGGFPTSARNTFEARLRVTTGASAVSPMYEDCGFRFTIIEAGFTFDSIGFIISVRKPRTG